MNFEMTEILRQEGDAAEGYRLALGSIVDEVFHTMLAAPIDLAPCESIVASDAITSMVCFDGTCDGGVWLRCSVAQAKALAGMFIGGTADLCELEVDDVMREVGNIIAGSLRQLLPHGISLGAAAVYRGPSGFIGEAIFSHMLQVCFQFEGDAFSVNLGEHENSGSLRLFENA